MSDLPDRDWAAKEAELYGDDYPDIRDLCAAYARGELKSRDEMNIEAAEGALHHAVFDLDAQTPQEAVARILAAAWGVADE